MNITITINCDNDAFGHRPAREVSRILDHASAHIDAHGIRDSDGKKLFDINGNSVGKIEVTE
jgi:hypothetical protein